MSHQLVRPAHLTACCVSVAVSQVATRIITFSMNLLIARQLSPEAYGVRKAPAPLSSLQSCTSLYTYSTQGPCSILPSLKLCNSGLDPPGCVFDIGCNTCQRRVIQHRIAAPSFVVHLLLMNATPTIPLRPFSLLHSALRNACCCYYCCYCLYHHRLLQLSAVQFHLITTTILFLSREGFRRGGLRIQEDSSSKKVLHPLAQQHYQPQLSLAGFRNCS